MNHDLFKGWCIILLNLKIRRNTENSKKLQIKMFNVVFGCWVMSGTY